MKTKTESIGKPRLALLVATGFGLGYLPIAPGTWGSLLGLALAWSIRRHGPISPFLHPAFVKIGGLGFDPVGIGNLLAVLAVSVLGVWTSGHAASYLGQSDPQTVVIDEVSGQMIALLGLGWMRTYTSDDLTSALPLITLVPVSWKYFVLGLILFRVFDIWKPFPARQAESLPGGWGIMADDWCAAVYAAVVLWLARGLGL